MKRAKRGVSLLLVLLMCMSCFVPTAFADPLEYVNSIYIRTDYEPVVGGPLPTVDEFTVYTYSKEQLPLNLAAIVIWEVDADGNVIQAATAPLDANKNYIMYFMLTPGDSGRTFRSWKPYCSYNHSDRNVGYEFYSGTNCAVTYSFHFVTATLEILSTDGGADGILTGGGVYATGSEITLGYRFKEDDPHNYSYYGWFDVGTDEDGDPMYSLCSLGYSSFPFQIWEDSTFAAYLINTDNFIHVREVLIDRDYDGGTVKTEYDARYYYVGEEIPLHAEAKPGYEFVGWYEYAWSDAQEDFWKRKKISDAEDFIYTVPLQESMPYYRFQDDLKVTAEFRKLPPEDRDYVLFGSYPQTEVVETPELIEAAAAATWTSYGYYAADEPGDWMEYADFSINNVKYRAVRLNALRPTDPHYPSYAWDAWPDYSEQPPNYVSQWPTITYYFKYEPLLWRVLDPEAGLLLCESIIDSQPFQNVYEIVEGEEGERDLCYNADDPRYYANNYASASIRAWLHSKFFETAFSAQEKEKIGFTTIDDSSGHQHYPFDGVPTVDRVFLPTVRDLTNENYGFPKYDDTFHERCAFGTDYAKCQGLQVNKSDQSPWWLRTVGYLTSIVGVVEPDGEVTNLDSSRGRVKNTFVGVRPAIYVSDLDTSVFEVSPCADPSVGGTVSGGGRYLAGAKAVLEAEPLPGYVFTGWYNSNGNKVHRSEVFPLTVTEDAVYTAGFAPGRELKLEATPSWGGIVTGGKAYADGSTATATATPYPGYEFAFWEIDGRPFGISNPYRFTITEDTLLCAHFSQIMHDVTALAGEGGTVSGGGEYRETTTAELTATPDKENGYRFVGWYNGDTLVSESAKYAFPVTEDVTLQAVFSNVYHISVVPDDPAYGTVSGSGDYAYGDSVTIRAVPNDGYSFRQWMRGAQFFASAPTYTFVLKYKSDATITAEFGEPCRLTAIAGEGGTVSEDKNGLYAKGSSVFLSADENDGYEFDGWYIGGTKVGNGYFYSFTITEDTVVEARFLPLNHTVTVVTTPGGTVAGAGTYLENSRATLTAVPDEGCVFLGWFENDGFAREYGTSYSFYVYSDVTLTAKFAVISDFVEVKAETEALSPGDYYLDPAAYKEGLKELLISFDETPEEAEDQAQTEYDNLAEILTTDAYDIFLFQPQTKELYVGVTYADGSTMQLLITPEDGLLHIVFGGPYYKQYFPPYDPGNPLRIFIQPKDVIAAPEGRAAFSVTATGRDLTYRWRYRASKDSAWVNSTEIGSDSAQLSFTAKQAFHGRQYQCVLTDADGNVRYSAIASLSIRPLVITGQPENVTAAVNDPVSFSVEATGVGVRYRWRWRTSKDSPWIDCIEPGSNTPRLPLAANEACSGRQYQCVLTDAGGFVRYSAIASLTVVPPLAITGQPESITVAAQAQAHFAVAATGGGLTYRWRYRVSKDSAWVNSSAAGSNTPEISFTAEAAYDGRQYQCVVTDALGKVRYSAIATLTVQNFVDLKIGADNLQDGDWYFDLMGYADWLAAEFDLDPVETREIITTLFSYDAMKFDPKSGAFACYKTEDDGTVQEEFFYPDDYAYETLRNFTKQYQDPNNPTGNPGETGLSITQQPDSITVAPGAQAKFSVTATGAASYRWRCRANKDSAWANCTETGYNTAQLSFTAKEAYNGRQYQCVLTDAAGNTRYTAIASLTVKALAVTAQPESVTAAPEAAVKFAVAATGAGIAYRWRYRVSKDSAWANCTETGYNTAQLSFTAKEAYHGRQYQCVLTDAGGNTRYTAIASLTVQGLVITAQPEIVTAAPEAAVKFTVAATGVGIAYRWRYRVSKDSAWVNCTETGYNTAQLSFTAKEAYNGRQYQCVLTDAGGNTRYTAIASLTVQGLVITAQPEIVTAVPEAAVKFTVAATGAGIAYRWRYRVSKDSAWVNCTETGYNTAQLSFTAKEAYHGRQYQCVLTDAGGNTRYTAIATLTVKALAVTAQPESITVMPEAAAKFTVAATGVGISYRWRYRVSKDSAWVNCTETGYNTAQLSFTAKEAYNGRQYQCVLTDAGGNTRYTAIASLTVQGFAITAQPEIVTAAPEAAVKFTVGATGAGIAYRWRYRVSKDSAWVNCTETGYNTAQLSFTAKEAYNGRQYQCVLTDAGGNTRYTAIATLTVKALAVTAQPESISVMPGAEAKFTVAATGVGIAYRWRYRVSKDSAWVNSTAAGSNTAQLSFTAKAANHGWQYQCVLTDAGGNTRYTAIASLTVQTAM